MIENIKSRYVWWCPYQGFEHLNLILNGWREHECVYVEDEMWIKLSRMM
jgi:ribosome modulation factor